MASVMDRINYAFDQLMWVSGHHALYHIEQQRIVSAVDQYKVSLDYHMWEPESIVYQVEKMVQDYKDRVYGFYPGDHLNDVYLFDVEWM